MNGGAAVDERQALFEGVRRFAAHGFAADAVALRRWDEQAREPGAKVPAFQWYREMLVRLMSD